ncbi:thioredoxin family protein [Verrucomicrobium sp. BvORR034]|uniref:thioredoxin family protein n=1 Tax=Verrucomicrobium sp. BvORR034 TaxID=1396418 RepID=UPI0006793E5A|nr:thioredoxin family protein [Verrucomicrobium sp. BvORR034]
MKTLIKSLALVLLTSAALVHAGDFPKGSPKFESSLRSALNDAKKNGKPIVAVYSAVWCGPCQAMKNNVYPSDSVKPLHDKFNWAYLDADDKRNEKDMKKFGVSGIPHIEFLNAAGESVGKQVGGNSPEAFASKLNEVLTKAGTAPATATAAADTSKK